MARHEPATFISHKGAISAGMHLLAAERCRTFTVLKRTYRGELLGYIVSYKSKDGRSILTESLFNRLQEN